MIAAINDLPFQYQLPSLVEVLNSLNKFVCLCKEIDKGHMTNVEKIVIRQGYDYSGPIAFGLTLQQAIQHLSKDVQRYLMGVLTRRDVLTEKNDAEPFCIAGKSSVVCANVGEGIVVSLVTHPMFESAVLNGKCGDTPRAVNNLSSQEHICTHKEILGIRFYHANSAKHKQNKENSYGKGKTASPMDLDDAAAQELLNRAVPANNRLYAKKDEKIYAFMEERPCIYHGYIDNKVPEHVRRYLDHIQWDT